MKTTAILDGDLVLHRAASATQQAYEWANGSSSISASFPKARERAIDFVLEWGRAVEANRIVIALSDPTGNYFRKQILPSYKAHRTGVSKPVLFWNLREWMEDAYECVWKDGIEGDDVAGILSTGNKYPGRKVIVSVDKDMLQVPGFLYRPHRKSDGIIEITPEQADREHLLQCLAGDATDGYKGIPGCGPVKAAKILDAPAWRHTTHSHACPCAAWPKVVAAYQKAGLTAEDALTQARVARILRAGDYHQNIGVRLWTPQQEPA